MNTKNKSVRRRIKKSQGYYDRWGEPDNLIAYKNKCETNRQAKQDRDIARRLYDPLNNVL